MEARSLVIGLTCSVLVLTLVVRFWGGSDDVLLDEPGARQVARTGGMRPETFGGRARQGSRAGYRSGEEGHFRDADTTGDRIEAPPRHRRGGGEERGEGSGAGQSEADEHSASAGANPEQPSESGRPGDTAAAIPGAGSAPPISNAKPALDSAAAKRGEELRGVQVAQAGTPGPDLPKQEPVLSISFDATTHPDQGESAPIVVDGVTVDTGGARFDTNAQFALPDRGNASMVAGTITFWVQPDWAGASDVKSALVGLSTPHLWENRLGIFKDGAFLRFLICDNTGTETNVGTLITDWKANDRHMVTATWGDGVTSLYVDARSVGAAEYNGELDIPPTTPLYIGSGEGGNVKGAAAKIGSFQVYNRALTRDEIASLFGQTR